MWNSINQALNMIDNFVWGVPLMVLIIAGGLLLTIRLGLLQIRKLPLALKWMLQNEEGGKGEISSFSALCTALSATIGTGNIVGVATAVCAGGPGALFWMVVAAFLGMATKYSEGLLAVKYRTVAEDGHSLGGPFYYIELGMGKNFKWLAKIFAFFGVCVGLFGIGTFSQVNGISSAVHGFFDPNDAFTVKILPFLGEYSWSVVIASLILSFCVAAVLIGGVKRIASVSQIIVPFMAVIYFVFAVILICHKKELIKGYFISGFTVALVFSPWLAVTIRQFVLRMRYDDGSTAELATLYSVMDYCKEWFSAVETPIGIVVLLGMALCLVLSYGAVDWVRQNHNIAPAIAFGTFALTGIVGGMISATVNNCFMGRYAFPGMGFVMLWYAVGFAQITENTKGKSRKIWAAGLLGTAGLCFLLQYTSEIRLEYDDGLETYENFVEEYMTENDAIIGPYTHTIFLNVYHPELHYYTIAYKLYSLPFVNTEALSSYSQLDTYDNLWYICFQGGYPNEMEDEYSYEQVLEFHYMYYDFAIFRLEKLEEE